MPRKNTTINATVVTRFFSIAMLVRLRERDHETVTGTKQTQPAIRNMEQLVEGCFDLIYLF